MRSSALVLALAGALGLAGGCILVLPYDPYGSGGQGGTGTTVTTGTHTGPDGGGGTSTGGTSTGSTSTGSGGAPGCRVELCHTPDLESVPGCITPGVCLTDAWLRRFPSDETQDVRALTVGTVQTGDRVYVAGSFRGTVPIGLPGATNTTGLDGGVVADEAYVASIDPSGNGLAATVVGIGHGAAPRVATGVADLHDELDVVVVGGTCMTDSSAESLRDGFVQAFPPSFGLPAWSWDIGGAGDDEIVAVASSESSVFALGALGEGSSTAFLSDCGGSASNVVPHNQRHLLLLRFDSHGNCVAFLKPSGGVHRPVALVGDGSSGVYVAGTYQGDLVAQVPSASTETFFVMRVDAVGQPVWTKPFRGGGSATPTAVAAVPGGVLVTGHMNGDVGFGAETFQVAQQSTFVLALDEGGGVKWATVIRGADSLGGRSEGMGVAPSADGGVLVSGTFFGSISIDLGAPGGGAVTATNLGAFLASFDADGHLRWFDRLGDGEAPTDHPLPIVARGGSTYLGLGWGPKLRYEQEEPPGTRDVIVAKLAPPPP